MGGRAYKIFLDENNECIVPWEVLTNPGTMHVSASSGNLITVDTAKVEILQSGYTDKELTTQDPTIDVYTSLMERMNEIDDNIADAVSDALQEAYDSGMFTGDPGEDGVGIKHVVLNSDYTLTIIFTDDSSYTTNQSIRGQQGEHGEDGYTPQKGIDYMTEAEKAEFVESALEAINDSGIYVFKGSVETYSELPDDALSGDVYNVIEAYGDYPAGTNFAWNGTEWDSLGGTFNLDIATDEDIMQMLRRLGIGGYTDYVGEAIVNESYVEESE